MAMWIFWNNVTCGCVSLRVEEKVEVPDWLKGRNAEEDSAHAVSIAIKYDPSNVQYLWERSSLYEQVGEHKQTMEGYHRILSLLPPSDGEHLMQLSRDMAKSYYESSYSV